MTVDATGTPTNLKIVKSAGADLDRNVLEAVGQYRFTPATVDNQASAHGRRPHPQHPQARQLGRPALSNSAADDPADPLPLPHPNFFATPPPFGGVSCCSRPSTRPTVHPVPCLQTESGLRGLPPSFPLVRAAVLLALLRDLPPSAPRRDAIHLRDPNTPSSSAGR